MVHLGSDAMASYVGMQGEGKVECRTVLRHGFEFSLRGEYEYLRSKKVQFDGVEKVDGVRLRVVENFLDGTQPFFQFAFVFATSAFFVLPMGGETLFGNSVHPFASYLYFNPLAVVAH